MYLYLLFFIFAANVVRSPLLQQQHQQYDEQLRDIAASLTRPRSRRALPPTLERPTRLPPPDRLPVKLKIYLTLSM